MKISVIHDYADVFRTTKHFAKLAGHEVVIHNDAYISADKVVEQIKGFDAVLLTQQRVPMTTRHSTKNFRSSGFNKMTTSGSAKSSRNNGLS